MTHEAGRASARPTGLTTTAIIAHHSGQPSHPTRARSIWSDLPLWQCATPAQRQVLADAMFTARQVAQDRRRRVLAHPDIAHRLVTELRYSRPEQWNGYVPPKAAYIDERDLGVPNRSPRRTALLEILTAVLERERAGR